MMTGKPILYSFYRSSCAWRVRIALAWKGIDYECKIVNLLKGEQHKQFKFENPQGYVPALITKGHVLSQSLGIMEYLDEAYPDKPLLPRDCPFKRADVRRLSLLIVADIQPIQNLSILKRVSDKPDAQMDWGHWVVDRGLNVFERNLEMSAGKYCIGDGVTMADVCLVPQVFNANRFKVDLGKFPIISRIHDDLVELDAFKVAHPSRQPDCPEHELNELFQRISGSVA